MKKGLWNVFFKGLCVGGTMLVPGVSGGSMAMILGIYDRLVSAVSSFWKDKKSNLLFLLLFSVGGGVGMVLFANPLLSLIERFPLPMLYFFIGAVAGGIPMMYRKSEVKKFSLRPVLYLLAGIAIVLLFTLIPADTFGGNGGGLNLWMAVLAGFVAAVALVLPGISVSYMLLLMGIYDPIMSAIGSFQIMALLPLGIGLILGILLTTKVLETAMKRYPQPTYLIIMGFIVGSLFEIFPGFPDSAAQWLICAATLLAGCGIILKLSSMEE